MASSIFFNGQQYTTPTTVSSINDAAMLPAQPQVGNGLVLVGIAAAAQPNTLLTFSNPTDAAATLMGGDLCKAVVKAFNAGKTTGAPGTVSAVRIGTSTQSTLNVLDASSAVAFVLTSNIYGVQANRIKVTFEPGSISGILASTSWNGTTYTQDNLQQNALTVTYAGTQATATLTVTPTAATLYAPAGTQVATFPFATYGTVGQLADAISAVAGFSASAVSAYATAATLYGLDSVTATSVKSTVYTVTANLQAVVNWLNGNAEPYVTATRPTAAGAVPAALGWTYLSGATDPATTITDWTNAFAALQTADVQWIVPLSPTLAVWEAVDAHVQYMSTVAQKERRAIVGPAAGTTLALAQSNAASVNSDRTEVVFPGHWDYSSAGVLTLYDSYQTAAILGAMFASVSPGTALTNQAINVQGLEVNVKNPSDTTASINSGLTTVEDTPNGYKVTRSISSWLVNSSYYRTEMSCGAAADYAARALRQAVDPWRGKGVSPQTLGSVLSAAETCLKQLAVPAPNGPGVLVGDANSPAWTGLVATAQGDQIALSVQVSPVIPNNFITIALSLVPYTGSASA